MGCPQLCSHRFVGWQLPTHRLAAGHHDVRVPVDSQDEVGQLSRDFNHLALTLGRNENLRRSFMADVSHELRTPLGILKGELEALEDGINPLNAEAVSSLQAEVARIGGLVEDLHELALSDAGALSYRQEPMDLVALLERAGQAHKSRFESAGLRLEMRLPPAPAMVSGDAARLLQLIDNLLENCRRYTDAPGTVQITCSLTQAPVRGNSPSKTVRPGVPAEMQTRRSIVLGTRRPGSFRRCIGAGRRSHCHQFRGGVAHMTTVLVIEDEPKLATLLANYLRAAELDPHVVSDGALAVQAVRDLEPAIVLLDLLLPGRDGVDICQGGAQLQPRAHHHAHGEGGRSGPRCRAGKSGPMMTGKS